ncbi:LysR family transcriptional regulator [Pseudomonas aegrilactucae]|uniref:LysR family transcriptional regulator n=1 Tax=Pseudomonas aegrilactucae TaxID=2854028 RepID=A0A9Q2XH13_9PSED|nr:LysR family transcriptional regulator [Pseudomonas aegrilactucae]MBV6286912.1 LysR family transcriptional regulator [Pseudomonas aegrilactucae]
MIETRLLRQFIAVAEELHVHRAAERLHIAQPALSQAIARLEHKLGCALFVRHPRGVQLTPAGDAFVMTARATLSTLHEGMVHAREVAEGVAGHLRVGSLALAGYPQLLKALGEFRQAWPKVRVSLLQQPSAQLAEGMLKGELDIAFMRYLPDLSERLHAELILDEPLLLAVPAAHRLAQLSRVGLAEVAEEDFVFTPPALGNGFHQHVVALCERAGFTPRLRQQAAQMQTLVSLVACGFGVALVPAAVAQANQQPGVHFCTLEGSPSLGLYMTTPRDTPAPLARRLAGLLGNARVPCPPR